jgi:Tfp pilus assembly protein PilV
MLTLMRVAREEQGFTLLEVLIMVVVLSVSLLGLSAITISTTRGLSFSDTLTAATTAAQELTERIKRDTYDAVTPANYPVEPYNSMTWYRQFQRAVTITDDAPLANMKTINVRVTWRDTAGQPHTVDLRSSIIR